MRPDTPSRRNPPTIETKYDDRPPYGKNGPTTRPCSSLVSSGKRDREQASLSIQHASMPLTHRCSYSQTFFHTANHRLL
jgi:hypothetical protein